MASALTNKVGFRVVVFVGAVFTAVGCVLSAFAPQLFYVHLAFGLLAGVGRGLVYTPSAVIVGMYFDKRRGLAAGITSAGVSVGSFFLAPLLRYLFDEIGYNGTFIILGGVNLHLCVCAMLFRNPRPKRNKSNIGDTDKSCVTEKETQISEQGKTEAKCVEDIYGSHIVELCESDKTNGKADSLLQDVNASNDHDEKANFLPDAKANPKKKRKLFGLQLLKDPLFLAFCVTIGLMTMAFQITLAFLPALADSKGLTKTESALLLSIMSIFDAITRVGSGIIFDAAKIRPYRRYIYNSSVLCIAVVTLLSTFPTSFESFTVISLLFGILTGLFISQKSVIVVDLLGVEVLVASFGVMVWFQGVGTFIGPPLAGYFRDVYKNYDLAFQFGGGITLLAWLILFISNLRFFLQNKKATEKTKRIAQITAPSSCEFIND